MTPGGLDVAWLTSDEGRDAIVALSDVDPLYARIRLPHLLPDQVAAALTQARHRPPDFPLPLVTVDGIQQASPISVAKRRAHRLAASGTSTVVDAGCGIGLDSWAFAHAGMRVVAYEVDPATAEVARANLAGLDVEVIVGDVTAATLPSGALFVDPARRHTHQDAQGRPVRIYDPQEWRPPWSWVLEQAGTGRPLVARTRPGQRDLPDNVEWHCSSIRRSLVDATVWFSDLARSDRRASVYHGASWHELTGPPETPRTGAVGQFILDPDPAIVRSGLVSNAAALAQGRLIDPQLAFITCDDQPPSWMGRSMRVIEQVRLKQVRAAFKRHGLPTATVWARGFERAPRVGIHEGQDAIVVAARLGPDRSSMAWIGLPVR